VPDRVGRRGYDGPCPSPVSNLTAEFRASVPAGERKRGIRIQPSRHDVRAWRPVADSEAGRALAEGHGGMVVSWTLQRWVEEPVGGYDGRAEVIIKLLSRDGGCALVREMIDNGVDLRRFISQPSHVGGGLHLLQDAAAHYVLLNQLLLALKDGERIKTTGQGVAGEEENAQLKGAAEGARRAAAGLTLRDALDAHDNRSFRNAAHCEVLRAALRAEGATAADVRAFCSVQFVLNQRGGGSASSARGPVDSASPDACARGGGGQRTRARAG